MSHGVHAGDAEFAHVGQQFRKPARHVAGFKTARLPLKGDGFQCLLHFLGVSDLGVLPQGVDHLRRFSTARALAHHELGRYGCVFQRLGQVHAGTHQFVDHVGHFVAGQPGVTRGGDDGARHLLFLRGIGHAGFDRDVTDDCVVIGADFGRDGHCGHTDSGLTNAAFDRGPALVDLRVTLGFQVRLLRCAAQRLIGLVEPSDLDPLLAQAVEVGIEFVEKC